MLIISMASPASAYVDNGVKWQYGFAIVIKDASIPSAWSNSLTQSMSAWNNAGADFYFYWIGGTDNKLYYKSLGEGSTLAIAHRTYVGDYMIKCTTDFNNDQNWSTTGEAGKFDVQSVATHEFGHWLSLGHSSNTEATMYPTVATGETKKRTLHSDDIAGIIHIYGE